MREKYMIMEEEHGRFINFILIGRMGIVKEVKFTNNIHYALEFENEEEAQATIEFIGAVINWELEEQLKIIKKK